MDASKARMLLPARIFSFYHRRLDELVRTSGDRWDTKKQIIVVLTTTRDIWEYDHRRQWNILSSTPRIKKKK